MREREKERENLASAVALLSSGCTGREPELAATGFLSEVMDSNQSAAVT